MRRRNRLSYGLQGLPLLIWSVSAIASDCSNGIPPSNPDSVYIPEADGTVIDKRTKLMWKVCAEGQAWISGTCSGSAVALDWSEALQTAEQSDYAGYLDWRVPNIKELQSLVERCRTDPAINESFFFNTPTTITFWSSSPTKIWTNWVWAISFHDGNTLRNGVASDHMIRLVRSSE